MATFLMEATILSFTIGGIVGAISALHFAHAPAVTTTAKAHDEFERN